MCGAGRGGAAIWGGGVRRCAAQAAAEGRCGAAEVRRCAAQDAAERRCGAAAGRQSAARDAAVRRSAAVLVSREAPRDAEQVLRAVAGLVFSVPVKARSWSARAKRQPKVTRWTHLFEP